MLPFYAHFDLLQLHELGLKLETSCTLPWKQLLNKDLPLKLLRIKNTKNERRKRGTTKQLDMYASADRLLLAYNVAIMLYTDIKKKLLKI